MVFLSSDLTDSKGRSATEGWLFYDADCPFCVHMAQRFARVLEPRGFAFAPLQDPRVGELLGLPSSELLAEMRLLTAEGRQYGGADAVVAAARKIWWAWPFYALTKLPGVMPILRAGYRWIAARRSCAGGFCVVDKVSNASAPPPKGAKP